jgi:hypothetical protein
MRWWRGRGRIGKDGGGESAIGKEGGVLGRKRKERFAGV